MSKILALSRPVCILLSLRPACREGGAILGNLVLKNKTKKPKLTNQPANKNMIKLKTYTGVGQYRKGMGRREQRDKRINLGKNKKKVGFYQLLKKHHNAISQNVI